MSQLPKMDREKYLRQMRTVFEKTLEGVADAVDDAPSGQVIPGSEEKARNALDEFRRVAFEKAIQLKTDAAEAAFPPSEQSRHKSPQTEQGQTKTNRVDGQWAPLSEAASLALFDRRLRDADGRRAG